MNPLLIPPMPPGTGSTFRIFDRRKTSPGEYLATPPLIVRSFRCHPEYREVVGDRTYIVPAYCSSPRRHSCGAQLAGHDFGDEDACP
ncbi:MAG TPA: hypothetical protein VFD36_10430 [Kofleriaceae bacterium]|nr:hypothetical protein [Kofleriaceae bacterium]